MRAPLKSLSAFCCGVLAACVALPAFGDDVVFPQNVRRLEAKALTQTGAVTEQGNVTIIEYGGNFDRGNTTARQDVATRFYQTHADEFDFLIFFTTFDI